MKPILIVANLKSNKTLDEGKKWIKDLLVLLESTNLEGKTIIICPPFILLPFLKSFISENNLPLKLGAQDISAFDEGAYTGEINGKQIKEFADYVLIGHSERRDLGENENLISKKVEKAIYFSLKPIFFVQDYNTSIPSGLDIIVYEPPNSISTVSGGIADDPKDVSETIDKIKKDHKFKHILYGGSVNSQNVSTFASIPFVDGVVLGKASLDPVEFSKIIENA